MRIEILDEQGAVTNTILAAAEFAEYHHPGMWRVAGDQDQPQSVTNVPSRVTSRQAQQALILAGVYGAVQPAINAIPNETERAMAQVEWDKSTEFERYRPLLIQLAEAIGLDSEAIDNLFITAAQL